MAENQLQFSRCNVLVVLFNNKETISSLLAGLENNADAIQTVSFVDNGSVDGTQVELLNQLNLSTFKYSFKQSENVGFAGGMYVAGKQVLDFDLPTLCLNPDLELATGVVGEMLKVMNTCPRAGIVTSTLIGLDQEPDSASIRSLPNARSGSIYAVLGKLLPKRLRYNSNVDLIKILVDYPGSSAVFSIPATTGALMLVSPLFVKADEGIFDRDYWMYGEDLQLCFDAKAKGLELYFLEYTPSIHLKGVSSGLPRKFKSNRAFHQAMKIYYNKNLKRSALVAFIIYFGIDFRLFLTSFFSIIVRTTRKIRLLYKSQR